MKDPVPDEAPARAHHSPSAAVGQVGRGASRAGGTLSVMARRRGRRDLFARRGIRFAARRHGMDRQRGTEPLQPPGGCGVPGRAIAARAPVGALRDGRRAGGGGAGEDCIRLPGRHGRTGRNGRDSPRERAGRPGRAGTLRGGVPGFRRGIAARRDVRTLGRRRRSPRSRLEAPGALRAGMRSRRTVVQRRGATRRRARSGHGRDCGSAGCRHARPGRRLAPGGGAGAAARSPAAGGRAVGHSRRPSGNARRHGDFPGRGNVRERHDGTDFAARRCPGKRLLARAGGRTLRPGSRRGRAGGARGRCARRDRPGSGTRSGDTGGPASCRRARRAVRRLEPPPARRGCRGRGGGRRRLCGRRRGGLRGRNPAAFRRALRGRGPAPRFPCPATPSSAGDSGFDAAAR